MTDLLVVADKLSFVSKLSLLFKATSDDSGPTPGYMYDEINNISYESDTYCEELEDWLNDRLKKRSSYVKLKVLRIMKYLVAKGHPKFRQNLRKKSQGIMEATKHSGPPDALHGNAHYLAVRREAQELSTSLFTIIDDDALLSDATTARTTVKGIGSMKTGGMHGFGNTANTSSRSIGGTIVDGLQDLAERVVDSLSLNSSGHRNDITFVAPSSTNIIGQFPGYKPIAVSSTLADSMDARRLQPEVHRRSRDEAVYRPGVAGGGWDDDDHDDDSECTQVLEMSTDRCEPNFDREEVLPQVKSASVLDKCELISSRSGFTVKFEEGCKSKVEIVVEESSAESKLVNGLLHDNDVPIPARSELKAFTTRCAGVNCGKVVELLAIAMSQSPIATTMRSLLAIEALLRTDLVTPRQIAVTCHKQLITLYTSSSNEECIRQKARKLIRILEKLAPKQAVIFSEIATMQCTADLSSVGEMSSATVHTAELPILAFPFLLTSNS